MTDYGLDDVNFLEKDANPDEPKSFTPLFELPGEMFNQSYPERIRHTFPENGKWTEKVDVNGQEVERWKKYIVDHYL